MRLLRILVPLLLTVVSGRANAQDSAIFSRCSVCHSMSGKNQIGPPLDGVMARKAASAPGYNYSPAMKAMKGGWDQARLDRFLAKPQQVVPGTKMAFAGLPNPVDRKAIIDYLRSTPK